MKKRKILKGYKVVKVAAEGVMCSAIMAGSARVIYKKKEWSYCCSECGPLAVFSSLHYALIFYKKFLKPLSLTYRLYKCDYEQSEKMNMHTLLSSLYFYYFPKGTILADRVKILRLVKQAKEG